MLKIYIVLENVRCDFLSVIAPMSSTGTSGVDFYSEHGLTIASDRLGRIGNRVVWKSIQLWASHEHRVRNCVQRNIEFDRYLCAPLTINFSGGR